MGAHASPHWQRFDLLFPFKYFLLRLHVRVCMVSAVSTGRFLLLGVQKIGRYEVLSHLASGGMGQVYLARATGLGGFERQVVVKTLDLSDHR